jgi:hypothetical protein
MGKIEERDRIIVDLANNLNVSTEDIKDCLKTLTPVFDNEVQEKIELAKTYSEKYKNKFFRDEESEYGCNLYYVRINSVSYNPEYDTFTITGESLTNLAMKIGSNRFSYEPCYRKVVVSDTLSNLKLVEEDKVYDYFSTQMKFFKQSCRNFLPQD